MLLGDTLILDNLDNANAYRQEVSSRGQVVLQWWCVACVLSPCGCTSRPLLVGWLSLWGTLFCVLSLGNCVLCSPSGELCSLSGELCSLFALWGTLLSLSLSLSLSVWGTLTFISK